MARDISTGVDQIVKIVNRKQSEQHQAQWRDLRNKIDTMLLSARLLKTDEVRQKCRQLDDMAHEDRAEFIIAHWGNACYSKIAPLLQQLESLETHLAKSQSAPDQPNKPV